eukprot:16808-Heterococcus_DN1.PRE.1
MADSTSSNGTTSINGSAPQSLHKATLSAVAEGAAVQGDTAANSSNILGNAATNTSFNKKLHGCSASCCYLSIITSYNYSLRHPSSLGSQGLLGAFTELNNGGAEEAKTELPETSTSETVTLETANTSAGSSTSTTAAQKPLTAAERFQAFLEQSSKNRSAKAAAASKGSAVRDATTGTATGAGTGTAAVNGGVSAGGGSRVT